MKILSAKQTREADKYTIENEPVSSIDLMERAAIAFTEAFINDQDATSTIHVICGPGNNGGDGMAISRLLLDRGYKVTTYLLDSGVELSDDCRVNKERLEIRFNAKILHIKEVNMLPPFKLNDVVIDAIFGTGLNRTPEGMAADIIKLLNAAPLKRYAVDIPSGMFADKPNTEGIIFEADTTYTFQYPKYSFFMPENFPRTGNFKILDIGLLPQFTDTIDADCFYLEKSDIAAFLKKRKKGDHKGTFGHALIAGGSYGKSGAIILSARACLRAGAGLVTVFAPACSMTPLQVAVPEAMVIAGDQPNELGGIPEMEKFDAIGIGPGMGTTYGTANTLEAIMKHYGKPMVLDADALNLLAKHKDLLKYIPRGSILTPHPREFDRLAGDSTNGYERIGKLRKLAKELNSIVLLKTAHTAIAMPEGNIYFNSSGNPGLATAGTGDVLTGIITSLLAQGYTSRQAAMLGVFLHGLAADILVNDVNAEAMIAGDLIDQLKHVFL